MPTIVETSRPATAADAATAARPPALDVRIVTAAAWAGVLLTAGWLYWETLTALPRIWDVDPNYSHGYLVPWAAAWFAWRAWRDNGPPFRLDTPAADAVSGAVRIGAGLALHAGSMLAGGLLLDVLSLILLLSGALLLTGGRDGYRPYAFAALFLVFMAPLPAAWYQTLAVEMQQFASAASAWLFQAMGVPVYRQGCYIRLPGYEMEVGAACSGLRQLAAIVALSLAVGHLSGRGRWYRWTLGLLSAPIAIAANCIRVTLTGLILLWFGREWAEGVYHTLEGMAIVGLAAGLILLAAWGLAVVADWGRGQGAGDRSLGPLPRAGDDHEHRTGQWPHRSLGPLPRAGDDHESRTGQWPHPTGVRLPVRLACLGALLTLAVVGQQALAQHLAAVPDWPEVPLRRPLTDLPLTLGEWRGEELAVEDRHRYADQHVKRVYRHQRSHQSVSVWAVYSSRGEDRRHHPEVCMAVAGMPEDTRVRQTLAVAGHPEPVQQYRFGRPGRREWVFYWHYTLLPENERSGSGLQRFYRQMRHRPSSVTLEVFAPELSPQDAEAAREFVRLLDAEIQTHLPPGAVRGSRRVPVTVVEGAG